jgi:hypothetical protein
MQPTIEGASPAQREILLEILSGLGANRVTRVTVGPFEPMVEGDENPGPGPYGDEIVVTTEPSDLQGEWEAELLAQAFARGAKAAGLSKIAWLSYERGGHTIEHVRPAVVPLSSDEISRFRGAIEAAAGQAAVERFDVLRPQGHAFVIAVRTEEPHRFLRFQSMTFLTAVGEWRERCDGIYGEIRDPEPTPVLRFGWYRGGGFSSTRRDVECCAPFLGLSHPIDWQGPPACPIFG